MEFLILRIPLGKVETPFLTHQEKTSQNASCMSENRYVLLCGLMFVLALILSLTKFLHGEISQRLGTDIYFTEIYKITISISQCSFLFLKRILHVCVATSLSIRSNSEKISKNLGRENSL